jgi:hypothetical protein
VFVGLSEESDSGESLPQQRPRKRAVPLPPAESLGAIETPPRTIPVVERSPGCITRARSKSKAAKLKNVMVVIPRFSPQ